MRNGKGNSDLTTAYDVKGALIGNVIYQMIYIGRMIRYISGISNIYYKSSICVCKYITPKKQSWSIPRQYIYLEYISRIHPCNKNGESKKEARLSSATCAKDVIKPPLICT